MVTEFRQLRHSTTDFAGFYGSEEALHKVQGKWRDFNARKSKGSLNIFRLCVGMRYRVIDGQIGSLREYGVHTAATGVFRGIHLHPRTKKE